MLDGVILTPLKIIDAPGGDVLHAMKCNDKGYYGFGEAYFSTIKHGCIKGWKKHFEMTLNLIVPTGEVLFVLYDDRPESSTKGCLEEIYLSIRNYKRLTVPPGIWVAFKGVGDGVSVLLNIADIPHRPEEGESKGLNEISYSWRAA